MSNLFNLANFHILSMNMWSWLGGEKDTKEIVGRLTTWAKYLHPQDFISNVFNTIIWGITRFLFGIANWAQEVTQESFKLLSFLDPTSTNGTKLFGMQSKYITYVVGGLMVLTMMWLGYRFIISKNPPQIKNVFFQLLMSAFLITSVGPMTNLITGIAHDTYNAATGTNDDPDENKDSLAFKVVKHNSNDLITMLDRDMTFTKANGDNVYDDERESWGHNTMTQKDFLNGVVGTTTLLDSDFVEEATKKDTENPIGKDNKNLKVEDLEYKLETLPADKTGDKPKTEAQKMDDSAGLLGSIMKPGYSRFTIDFMPTVIGLIAIAVAYFFASFVIVKSILDLMIMQIIAVLVAATDLDTGEKTKKVVESIFQGALTIAFTGIELAFYELVITSTSSLSGWIQVITILAATMMLITGSEKVATFFGVDTGAQKGWKAAVGAAVVGSSVARGVSKTTKAAKSVPGKIDRGIRKTAQMPSNIKKKTAEAGNYLNDVNKDRLQKKNEANQAWDRLNNGQGNIEGDIKRTKRNEDLSNIYGSSPVDSIAENDEKGKTKSPSAAESQPNNSSSKDVSNGSSQQENISKENRSIAPDPNAQNDNLGTKQPSQKSNEEKKKAPNNNTTGEKLSEQKQQTKTINEKKPKSISPTSKPEPKVKNDEPKKGRSNLLKNRGEDDDK